MNLRKKIENCLALLIALITLTGIVLQRGDLLTYAVISWIIFIPFVWRRAFPKDK